MRQGDDFSPTYHRVAPYLLALAVFVVTASWAGWSWQRDEAARRYQGEALLERTLDEAGDGLRQRLLSQRAMLVAVSGAWGGGLLDDDPGAWRRYFQVATPKNVLPGVVGAGLFVRASGKEALARIQQTHRSLHRHPFVLHEISGDEEHLVGVAVDDEDGGRYALGLDFMGNPVQKNAVEKARDSGGAIFLPDRRLNVFDHQEVRSLHILPVYEPGRPVGTVEQRRLAWRGIVFLVIDTAAMLEEALSPVSGAAALAVRDAGNAGNIFQSSLWDDFARDKGCPSARVSLFLDGREFDVQAQVRTDLLQGGPERIESIVHLVAGLLLAAGLAGGAGRLACRTLQAKVQIQETAIALEKSEERYRQLFARNQAVELLINPSTGEIVDANQAASAFYGWSLDELRRMHIGQINTLAPAELVVEMNRAIVGKRDSFEFQHRLASGEVRDVEVYAGPVSDGMGQPMLYSIVHDITERKQAEQALADSAARFRSLFEQNPLAIQVLDRQGRTMKVNWAWENLWGIRSDDALAAGWVVTNDPQLVEAGFTRHLQRAFLGERVEIAPFSCHCGAGEKRQERWLKCLAWPLAGGSSPGGELILIYQDITSEIRQKNELQLAMQRLSSSNRDLEQFVYVASHDLQEPLRMVASYVGLLNSRYGASMGDDAREFMKFAVTGAHRMHNLISDLMEYSCVGRSADITLRPSSVQASLQRVLERLDPLIRDCRALVHSEALPMVMARPDDLDRLLYSLVENAIKYRRPHEPPKIQITVNREGPFWRFFVADNGIGIDEQYHSRIFLVFQRLHPHETYEGTGIGLAICKKIVSYYGGEIGVRSQGECLPGSPEVVGNEACQCGATFWFTLPVAES